MNNTLNVCLGHQPFPAPFERHVDLMIAPLLLAGPRRLALVEDSRYGPHGSSLSEYAQLLWLNEHLDEVAAESEFVRIFHYRRFVSIAPPLVGIPTDHPWSTGITESELAAFEAAFDRDSETEVYNTPFQFTNGSLGQYADAHHLEDILRFAEFLSSEGILTSTEAVAFLLQSTNIPACNIGVFRRATFRRIFEVLRRAAEFVHSPLFVPRDGYQRRTAGFLLERLNSHLILSMKRDDSTCGIFGNNIIISDGSVVTHTVNI